jgi:hypothetical protein
MSTATAASTDAVNELAGMGAAWIRVLCRLRGIVC